MVPKVQTGDTIAATATAPGRGAIGIIRISGPRALEIAASCFTGKRGPGELPGGSAAVGWIERDGEKLDQVMCLVMRAPNSYTGEDTVEFHCHAGPATLRAALAAVIAAGARPAGPGEFTRRAFLSGRIDLARAEAVADLISSETETARRMAVNQLAGGLSREIGAVRDRVRELAALVEAGIDFSDEDDVVAVGADELAERLAGLEGAVSGLLAGARQGRRIREGARVVIAGRPNVGKSTLMNALLGSERVIVTAAPGTTRDVVEDLLEIEGMAVRLSDTAGIREVTDEVERIGVDRARSAAAGADLVLVVVDGSRPLTGEDAAVRAGVEGPAVVVVNKTDLPSEIDGEAVSRLAAGAPIVRISALGRIGIETLTQAVARALLGESSEEVPLIADARHADALTHTRDALARAREAAGQRLSDEFIAADLHSALDHLGLITGETADDELLDIIFSRFCIGK